MDHEGKDRVGIQCSSLGRGAHTRVNCYFLKAHCLPPRYVQSVRMYQFFLFWTPSIPSTVCALVDKPVSLAWAPQGTIYPLKTPCSILLCDGRGNLFCPPRLEERGPGLSDSTSPTMLSEIHDRSVPRPLSVDIPMWTFWWEASMRMYITPGNQVKPFLMRQTL